MAKLTELSSGQSIPHFSRVLHGNYRSTIYRCHNCRIVPGLPYPAFQAVMAKNDWRTFAFVTAWNPFSVQQLPLVENQARHEQLVQQLTSKHLTFLPATATDPSGIWPDEAGVFVFNCPLEEVINLGRRFAQNAILWAEAGRPAEVLWCYGKL